VIDKIVTGLHVVEKYKVILKGNVIFSIVNIDTGIEIKYIKE
jgi:hypothetical protein